MTLRDPRGLSRWESDIKQAPRYRVGRAFLAGDAAHTHSPAGGQGMNTGMQDAFNLGWKLKQVLRGEAPEALLDSYQTERHPVGRRAITSSDLILRSLLVRHQPFRWGRDQLFRLFLPFSSVQSTVSHNLSGVNIHYAAPPEAGALAGKRVPDIELRNADFHPVRLYELLRLPSYTLIVYLSAQQVNDERATLLALLALAEQDGVPVHLVLNAGLPQQHELGAEVLIDYKGEFEKKLSAHPGQVFLLRPDAYIAFSSDSLNVAALLKNWRQWINSKREG